MTLVPSKHARKEIEAEGSRLVRYVQQSFRLAQAERENTEDIKTLKAKVATLEIQVHDLKTREEMLLARSEAAASQAVAKPVIDLALRIGRIEGRVERE